jgi:hypothetical protein
VHKMKIKQVPMFDATGRKVTLKYYSTIADRS